MNQPPKQPLSISLHAEHVQLIINVLGTRPHDEVRGLIDHIVAEANAQIAALADEEMARAGAPVQQASAQPTEPAGDAA